VIEARQLTKRFGGRIAIEDVSFRVERGEVVGFLGPNGAGKTTTMRILAGAFPPSAGRALIDGHDVVRAPLAARRRLGYAPERPALHLEMTVRGLLGWAAAMRDVADRRGAVEAAVKCTGLAQVDERRIGALSKGFRQRLGLALAILGDPPALLLDEPTAGLDPEQSADTRQLLRELGTRHAVLVSSHALAEVEATCDRVVVLHRGRVLSADLPSRLAARLGATARVDVEAAAPPEPLAAALRAVPGVRGVTLLARLNGHTRCRVEMEPGQDPRAALAARVVGSGWDLVTLAPVETSLEESFLALLARENGDSNQDSTDGRERGEAERESARPGRRGPGASEARSAAKPREHWTGPRES
jgi:ABC-2 type transport system ATP-binding protein